jgi:hypothetical protein
MSAAAGGVGVLAALSLLWDATLGPWQALLAIMATTLVTGLGVVVLLCQREKHRHEASYLLPVARPPIDVRSHPRR